MDMYAYMHGRSLNRTEYEEEMTSQEATCYLICYLLGNYGRIEQMLGMLVCSVWAPLLMFWQDNRSWLLPGGGREEDTDRTTARTGIADRSTEHLLRGVWKPGSGGTDGRRPGWRENNRWSEIWTAEGFENPIWTSLDILGNERAGEHAVLNETAIVLEGGVYLEVGLWAAR